MRKKLSKLLIGSTMIIGVSVITPTPTIYAWMTGSTTKSKQDEQWENKSSENDSRYNKCGRKFLEAINPYNTIIEGAEKFGEAYKKYRDRKGNVGTGTGVIRDEDWE